MAKAKAKEPTSKVTISYFGDRVEVEIDGFEKLTPAKIQRSLAYVLTNWQRQQQSAIYAHRRREKDGEERRRGQQL